MLIGTRYILDMAVPADRHSLAKMIYQHRRGGGAIMHRELLDRIKGFSQPSD